MTILQAIIIGALVAFIWPVVSGCAMSRQYRRAVERVRRAIDALAEKIGGRR